MLLLLLAASLAADPSPRTWTVGDAKREALVVVPTGTPTRLVFDFHGHGGTARHAARTHALHTALPDAVVVYPQGLPTKTPLDPAGTRAGWQLDAGPDDDRDLKFFDAILADLLKDHRIDPKRVYATGHSNGGGFTDLLWAERGDKLAAVAPVAPGGCGPRVLAKLTPKPCLHVAGEKDPLVKYPGQRRVMDAVKKLNKCDPDGTPWEGKGKRFPSKTGAEFVEVVHPGGHEYPDFAGKLIATFFKQHPAD